MDYNYKSLLASPIAYAVSKLPQLEFSGNCMDTNQVITLLSIFFKENFIGCQNIIEFKTNDKSKPRYYMQDLKLVSNSWNVRFFCNKIKLL